MRLTGVPLILLAALTTLAAGAATVRWWSRGKVVRIAGVLLLETAAVLTAGLAVNRHEEFYPSWQALGGDTGTVTRAEPVRAGLLDDHVVPGSFAWRPPGFEAWHLAGPPSVTLPAGYRERPGVAFPVVLVFGAAVHPRTEEAVTVRITPTARTTPADVAGLASALRRDLRVTARGWAVEGATDLVRDRPAADLPPALAAPLTLPS